MMLPSLSQVQQRPYSPMLFNNSHQQMHQYYAGNGFQTYNYQAVS